MFWMYFSYLVIFISMMDLYIVQWSRFLCGFRPYFFVYYLEFTHINTWVKKQYHKQHWFNILFFIHRYIPVPFFHLHFTIYHLFCISSVNFLWLLPVWSVFFLCYFLNVLYHFPFLTLFLFFIYSHICVQLFSAVHLLFDFIFSMLNSLLIHECSKCIKEV